MRSISLNLIVLLILLTFNVNKNIVYIETVNLFEIVYVVDRKISNKLKRIKKLKKKFFSLFFSIKKEFKIFLKKVEVVLDHKKINDMVNLE